jgi:2-iminobutanoate/2-iminopropanoate deaminase
MTAGLPCRSIVAAGELLFVSGQIGVRDGGLPETVSGQMAQALQNLRAVLESRGASLTDVVKTTVFLTDMADYAEMNQEYGKVFSTEPPARSAVAVGGLPFGALIEIEAVAFNPGS